MTLTSVPSPSTLPTGPFTPTISVRKSLPIIIGVGLLVPFVLISVAVYTFIYRTEEQSWHDRQAEAAAFASTTVAHFVEDALVPLDTLGLIQRTYLELRPEFADDLLQQNDALLELLRLDQRGQVYVSAYRDEATLAQQLTMRQSTWFARALAGERYISEVQLTGDNALYLIVSAPAPPVSTSSPAPPSIRSSPPFPSKVSAPAPPSISSCNAPPSRRSAPEVPPR